MTVVSGHSQQPAHSFNVGLVAAIRVLSFMACVHSVRVAKVLGEAAVQALSHTISSEI